MARALVSFKAGRKRPGQRTRRISVGMGIRKGVTKIGRATGRRVSPYMGLIGREIGARFGGSGGARIGEEIGKYLGSKMRRL